MGPGQGDGRGVQDYCCEVRYWGSCREMVGDDEQKKRAVKKKGWGLCKPHFSASYKFFGLLSSNFG